MVEFFLWSLTCPAMALTARRTLAKVNSSAIRPRQPEVPNLMGEAVIALYSSPERWKIEDALRNSRILSDLETARGCRTQTRKRMKEKKMVAGKRNRVVLVTCESVTQARRIANGVVRKRLAACVNIVLSPVQSIYRWKGKVERAREVLMMIKTCDKRLAKLEKEVKR